MLLMTHHPDVMKEELRELETQISELRLRQAVIVNELDKVNTAGADGHRSMPDWVSSWLDVEHAGASELVSAARLIGKYRPINLRLAEGRITFDRALATMRLAEVGADEATVLHSESLDLAGVRRLTAMQRRVGRRDEREVAADRFLAVQPTLDESAYRVSGVLTGTDGRLFERSLYERADEMRLLPGGENTTRGQRQADALVAMAMDSLDRNRSDDGASPGAQVSVFVDLDEANGTGGESGSAIEYGPRVGPNTLEELLCTGSVRVIGLSGGKAIATSDAARVIPAAVRRLVAHRDGGCTIVGCTSRYRLEPHHIIPRSRGGTHDPENLTTLCWFHHHIAVHLQGFHIDPDSPPSQRRLTRLPAGPDPPRRT